MKKTILLMIVGLVVAATDLIAQLGPLKGVTAKEVRMFADSASAIPGKSFKIGVEVTAQNGVKFRTKGLLNGDLGWKEFDIKVIGGTYDFTSPGVIAVSEKQSDFLNDYIRVSITSKDNPAITAQLDVPVLYLNENKLIFYSTAGATGATGKAGSFVNGGTGMPEQGVAGAKGFNGPTIYVYVKPVTINGRNILEARVVNMASQKETTVKIDPAGGKLLIYSIGGQGGTGGQGGAGDKSAEKCYSSNGAAGGNGGNGGDGGEIIFYVDSRVSQYQGVLIGYSQGGKAGDGGKGGAGGASTPCKTTGSFSKSGVKGAQGAEGQPGKSGPVPKYLIQ